MHAGEGWPAAGAGVCYDGQNVKKWEPADHVEVDQNSLC
jgi:hypothetical protein